MGKEISGDIDCCGGVRGGGGRSARAVSVNGGTEASLEKLCCER